jgi:RHS repeat-associated protein
LQFFPTAEGYFKQNQGAGIGTGSYVFNYTDHLGNVRVSYIVTNNVLNILEENNYYPFGMKHSPYNESLPSSYKYKYNGKELQDELGLNLYDYEARNYDPALGRWMNIDPLAEQMRRYSPYNYCFDNPIRFTDPDGMAPEDIVTFNMQGKEISRIQSNTVFKTYVQKDDGATVEAPMPNVIGEKSGMNTTGSKYQKYDYNIAAETAIFNINKDNGITPLHSNGKSIDDPSSVSDLNPTLVKATIMQESTMGTYDRSPRDSNDSKSDIMQANVYYGEKSND